ncbi:MAG: isoprenoid biosynthesis glyoxalase ElbB [Deltaproteobacteria bacterium]|nr:isoprenoid biosynthesis glyoxalase ElbB [Deltaproteobacteria bacterium]
MSKRVAVILSGCGVQDGAEIHESVLTLLHLAQVGAVARCYAPNVAQTRVMNHLSGEAETVSRNALVEAARIARGEIADLALLTVHEADAVIFPGGFGAALNLCSFGTAGVQCTVHPEVERVVRAFHAARKPIGAICIAPAVIAKVLGAEHPRLTIGTDPKTAQQLEAMGAVHVATPVDQICVDDTHRVVTTPAYMLATTIAEADAGISRLVTAIVRWA